MIFAILGQTNSGKSTMIKKLNSIGYNTPVEFTTRPKREGEVDGVDYHFLTKKQYNKLRNEKKILHHYATTCVDGDVWEYGFDIEKLKSKKVVIIANPTSLKILKEHFESITTIYLAIDYKTRLKRGLDRNDYNKEEIERRFEDDQKHFSGLQTDFTLIEENQYQLLDQLCLIIGDIERKKQVLNLVSDIPPSVNSYRQHKVVRKGRRIFAQPYLTKVTKTYIKKFKKHVKEAIKKQKWKKPDKNTLIFVECNYFLDKKRKDPNNLLKVMFDVLSEAGVFVDDDIALPLTKGLKIDPINPRIDIKIYEADSFGVFDNYSSYLVFIKNNCVTCKRRKRNCSILRGLIENKVSEEVVDNTCLKNQK